MEDKDNFKESDPTRHDSSPLSEALYESSAIRIPKSDTSSPMVIGFLPGEGVGPELVQLTKELLEVVAQHWKLRFDFRTGGSIGTEAEAACGQALPNEVAEFCDSVFKDQGALLCGAGGGRFVYELRARFDLFCKFTPIQPLQAVSDSGCLRPEAVEKVDMIVVRDNTGGLYYSEASLNHERAIHTFKNERKVIERLVQVAVRLAKRRSGKITLAVKRAAIKEASQLWSQVFNEQTEGTGLHSRILEIDNANYQIIADARSFDVLVTPNMFGDLLSDGAALLLGSRGMSFSGNFSDSGTYVFQTAHGSAHDLAGTNQANPVGQILSAAMLLRESFNLIEPAAAIEAAVEQTLASGIRTPDIAAPGCQIVGTRELAQAIQTALTVSSVEKSTLA